ncbi:hypothetical protein GQX73_g6232 [Xylaria multiplex]|uniref:DUF6536 domain-containing protein n=1 Tax=Xylaria multiplex TaxID=323545 RepID=A0A7C8N3B5_9PEZI|nr:hypothetical protein GQX73_g6232 [Xylaria multiplex]
MQVLSAPSREEIDRAHARLQSLDIGVPSVKNLWHMSWFKMISWFIFFFSSIPIHLFFNSAIFRTENLGSGWHLSIATEAFTQGAPYLELGASLSPPGSPMPYNYLRPHVDDVQEAYGDPVLLDSWYYTPDNPQNLSSDATKFHGWDILDAKACQDQYISCSPRTTYGDVVVIVETGAYSPEGWVRSEVFGFQPPSNLSTYWDKYIPSERINSLWFSAQCHTKRDLSGSGLGDTCSNTCLGALNSNLNFPDHNEPSRYFGFNPDRIPSPQEPWFLTPFNGIGTDVTLDPSFKFNHKFDKLRVRYCLAEPVQPTCRVGVSNALLLVVVLCVFIKVILASIVVGKLPTASLVTPGDAIESFLSNPDPKTRGVCTLDITDTKQIEYSHREELVPTIGPLLSRMIRMRKWPGKQRRLAFVIGDLAWARTYAIITPAFLLLVAGFGLSSAITKNNYSVSFGHTNQILAFDLQLDYFGALLLANTPQLIFSLCYIVYNALITHLQVEKEWNSFGSDFQPLRVSYPVGEQVSSYRLQLPYRYSIPMIAISIILHWVVSNAVFLYIIDGGYVQNGSTQASDFLEKFGISKSSFIAIGYSPFFLLVLFIASFIFIVCPPLLIGAERLKYKMVAGGYNSLVISAACHPSDLKTWQQAACKQRSLQSQRSLDPTHNDVNAENLDTAPLHSRKEAELEIGRPLKLSQRKLRWGAMALPRSLARSIAVQGGRQVHHLGFGAVEDGICEPNKDHFYV